MNLKLIVFFVVILFTLLYFVEFWENRHQKVEFHLFGQKMEITLGLLLFAVFLDGAIIAGLLYWLLS